MRTNSFYKTTTLVFFILLSYSVIGQNKLSKEIRETHAFSNDGSLYLDNKYGDIYINGWDKDFIEIVGYIEVQGKNSEKSKERLDRIESKIIATNKQVIVKSEIAKKDPSVFNRYMRKIDPFKTEKTNTIINYTIYLPMHAEVEVYNKYGDIIISGWNGDLKANVEHGDLRLTDSITNSKLSIQYGKLRASTLYKSSVYAKDASLFIKNSKELKLDSNGSEIDLDVIDNLELYSNKDNLDIEQLNSIFGTVKYSKVILNKISEKVNLDLNLAELKILKFTTTAPLINIDQRSSEVYINISKTSFGFTAKLEQGVLRIPKTMQNIDSKMLDEKNKLRYISASYGEAESGTFVFTGQKGVIILKEL